jgi:uncharacterized protein (TIGR02001 family)
MKFSKIVFASALLAGAGVVQAELSANLGVSSNYYFRGITQTDDKAAVSGGIDYKHDSGVYVGTWMSNVDFGGKEDVEVDGYLGFANDIGDSGFSYDLNAQYYWYPGSGGDAQDGELDYSEVIGSLSWSWLTGMVGYTAWAEGDGPAPFQDGDLYYSLNVAPDWSYEGFAPSVFIGYYDFDNDGDCADCDFNYTHWGIAISKDAGDFGSLSFNYEQIDDANDAFTDDNANFWLGWVKGF